MRALTGILIFLLVTSTLLGFYQWQDHLNMSAQSDDDKIEEQITIEEQSDYLTIEHKISGLNEGNFEAELPQFITNLSCVNSEGCEIEEGETLVVENLNDLTVTYEAPIKPLISEVKYNQDWLINLQPVQIADFTKERTVTLSANKEGKWLSSSKPMISSKRESIHYYEWRLYDEQNLPLYKFYEDMQLIEELEGTGIYSTEVDELTDQENDFFKYEELFHNRLVVISEQLESVTLSEMVIVNDIDRVNSELLKSHLKSITKNYSDDYDWVVNELANNFFVGDSGQVVEEFTQQLTEEQQDQLLNILLQQTKQVDETLPNYIDQLLSDILGYEVDFIKQNHGSNTLLPLSGIDLRTVYFDEQEVDFSVRLNNEGIYVSVEDIIELAELNGFNVNGRSEWFIQYENDRYRFYVNRDVYTINDQRYSAQPDTWFQYGSDLYVDYSLIESLFDFTFSFSDEEIRIK
ncbi:hypothetical protein [Alkalibacillus haloalkaliphilus]|uniref:hypothetical protein n=1 Tax=Alkalibacillus haloalkaliphilus TaxID=94136 RepID=UPI00293564B8|nr:hypothetical protein [Alkalibacillus haloalkaliphilus]MDV2582515.1 hypothetical protein [Alkalibacillus haloalkaliphilus]